MANTPKSGVDRRGFLKGAAVGAAGGATALVAGVGNPGAKASAATPAVVAPPPTPQQIRRDAGNVQPPEETRAVQRPGSDLMVQGLKDLGIEYVASNPGSSFEALQESIVNYGDPPNVMPEFITALHEETAVDMANGYGKAEGRPMCALLHGTIGLQHAAMAIYQAYCSGTPVLLLAGRDDGFIGACHRRPISRVAITASSGNITGPTAIWVVRAPRAWGMVPGHRAARRWPRSIAGGSWSTCRPTAT